jgi:hypothetical protein
MDARGQGVFRVGRSHDDKAGTPPDLRVARLASEQDGIVDLRQLMSIGLNRPGCTYAFAAGGCIAFTAVSTPSGTRR